MFVNQPASIIFIFLLLVVLKVNAQDIHFTQFYNTPTLTNPAQTGNTEGDMRFGLISRDQWRPVKAPYFSFSGWADFSKVKSTPLSIGTWAYFDRTGSIGYTTAFLALSASYSIYIKSLNTTLAVGLQGSLKNRSFNSSSATFGNQYSTVLGFNPNINSQETLANTGVLKLNMGSGVLATFQKNNYKISLGFAMKNIINQNESFNSFLEGVSNQRFTTTLEGDFASPWSKIKFNPFMLYDNQANFSEFALGGLVHYNINYKNYKKISSGLLLRHNDAIALLLGVTYKNIAIGLSYDLNFSTLSTVNRFNGAWEISIKSIKFKLNKIKLPEKSFFCPNFI